MSEGAGPAGSGLVYVRSEKGKDSLSLSFQLHGREYRLLRSKDEPVGKALKRITTNLSRLHDYGDGKVKKKKKKKLKGEASAGGVVVVPSTGGDTVNQSSSVEVVLYSGKDDREVSYKTPNREAWVNGNTLRVCGTVLLVAVNVPSVRFLHLPDCILATCPVVPIVELEFADGEQCLWCWRRCPPTQSLPPHLFPDSPATDDRAVAAATQNLSSACRDIIRSSPVIATSLIYWTSEEDEGHSLILECTLPNRSGAEESSVVVASKNPVSQFLNPPMAERHLLTPSHISDPQEFRIATYNILANVYASSEHARTILYPYCHPSGLDQDYRHCLIAREVLGYHADIVCLQEVGEKTFSQFLSPALQQWVYDGRFHAKAGRTPEGEAVFFNTSKFSLVHEETIVLREYLQEAPNCRDLLSLDSEVIEELLKRHNILQTVLLKSTELSDTYVLVANTHLYFHPRGDHLRLLQVVISLRYLEKKVEEYRREVMKEEDDRMAVVFSGDFNSCPATAAYSYLTTGQVSRHHPDWTRYRATEEGTPSCSCKHREFTLTHENIDLSIVNWMAGGTRVEPQDVGSQEEVRSGLNLSHSFHFTNACGTEYSTNITLGWTGVIDYIFLESDWLETARVVPFPSPEQLTEHIALPSVNFPSDHIALVADLAWKTHTTTTPS